jgi:hypothetical protein
MIKYIWEHNCTDYKIRYIRATTYHGTCDESYHGTDDKVYNDHVIARVKEKGCIQYYSFDHLHLTEWKMWKSNTTCRKICRNSKDIIDRTVCFLNTE